MTEYSLALGVPEAEMTESLQVPGVPEAEMTESMRVLKGCQKLKGKSPLESAGHGDLE